METGLMAPTGRFPAEPEPWALTAIALASSGWAFGAIAEMLPDKTEADVRDALNRYQGHVAVAVQDLKMPVEQLFRGLLPKAINRYHRILDDDTVSAAVHARVASDVVSRIEGTPVQRKTTETRTIQVMWHDIPGNDGVIGDARVLEVKEIVEAEGEGPLARRGDVIQQELFPGP